MCGIDMNLFEKLDFIEFRQDLIFRKTSLDRVLYEYRITRKQHSDLVDIMNKYENLIDDNQEAVYIEFEKEVHHIIERHGHQHGHDHHHNYEQHDYEISKFPKLLAEEFFKQDKFKNVFLNLYQNDK